MFKTIRMEDLLELFESIHPISANLKEQYTKILKFRHLKKGEHLFKAGQPIDYIFYVHNGLLRCYYTNINGKEVSIRFIKEHEVVTMIANYFNKRVGYESIHALEDTELYYITYKDHDQLLKEYPEYNVIVRVLLERFFGTLIPRFYMSNLPQAKQRYAFLLNYQPDFVGRVPLKYLASYLGIAETSLSRIRKQKIKLKDGRAQPNVIPTPWFYISKFLDIGKFFGYLQVLNLKWQIFINNRLCIKYHSVCH